MHFPEVLKLICSTTVTVRTLDWKHNSLETSVLIRPSVHACSHNMCTWVLDITMAGLLSQHLSHYISTNTHTHTRIRTPEARRCRFRLAWAPGFVFGDVFGQDTEGLWWGSLHSCLNINSFLEQSDFPVGFVGSGRFLISCDLFLVPLFITENNNYFQFYNNSTYCTIIARMKHFAFYSIYIYIYISHLHYFMRWDFVARFYFIFYFFSRR